MYPVVFPSGVGGVQETRIAVEFSWTAMRSVGTEAAVMRIMHRVDVSLCIHMGANILSSKTYFSILPNNENDIYCNYVSGLIGNSH